jgi:hypothetical protein
VSPLIEIKLPDDIMENCPQDKAAMGTYLAEYLNKVIAVYEKRFQQRVKGALGGPLSNFEKALLRDFMLEALLGGPLRQSLQESGPILLAAES